MDNQGPQGRRNQIAQCAMSIGFAVNFVWAYSSFFTAGFTTHAVFWHVLVMVVLMPDYVRERLKFTVPVMQVAASAVQALGQATQAFRNPNAPTALPESDDGGGKDPPEAEAA